MRFVLQKAIKCQAIMDFPVEHPVQKSSKLFFNDIARRTIVRVRIVFESPQKHVLPHIYSLIETFSNNVAGYNTLLIGL